MPWLPCARTLGPALCPHAGDWPVPARWGLPCARTLGAAVCPHAGGCRVPARWRHPHLFCTNPLMSPSMVVVFLISLLI